MKWVEALKVFNQGKPMWCVARKGTPEYDEVKKIMMRDKPEAVAKRNEERGEKVKEQLKEIASASSKRREEARRKYAEKLAEMEHHKELEKKTEEKKKKNLEKAKAKGQAHPLSFYLNRVRDTWSYYDMPDEEDPYMIKSAILKKMIKSFYAGKTDEEVAKQEEWNLNEVSAIRYDYFTNVY
jgi:hypothetical protein